MEDEDRTTDMGLFNYAHTYWSSAAALQGTRRTVTHPDAPVYYLYFHAVELYLKSFLRLKGYPLKELVNARHDAVRLCHEARSAGLAIDEYETGVISTIPSNYMPARYIKTGYRAIAHQSDLWDVCYRLHSRIEPLVNEKHGVSRIRIVPHLEGHQPPAPLPGGN